MSNKADEEIKSHIEMLGHLLYYTEYQVYQPLSISERTITHILNDTEFVPSTILDLGCGCGCVGVILADTLKDSHVTLIDNSDFAIGDTNQNIAKHSLTNTTVIKGDIFQDLTHSTFVKEKYDLIVANLPYLGSIDYERHPCKDRLLPKGSYATTGNCFRDYFKLINYLDDHLNYGGRLYLILPSGKGFLDYIKQNLCLSDFKRIELVDVEGAGVEGIVLRITKEAFCKGNTIYDDIQNGVLTPESLTDSQIVEVAPVFAKKIKRGATTLANLPENLQKAIINLL